MRVLTLRQPWATLVAIGAKRIETRSWSTAYRGRILIHAGARPPDLPTILGPYSVGHYRITWPDHVNEGYTLADTRGRVLADGVTEHDTWPLPLGAIVASAVLTDVVPIIDWQGPPNPDGFVEKSPDGARLRVALPDGPDVRADEELPFGDYTPCRFAWLLDDVAPTLARCPRCWGTGNTAEREFTIGPAYNADEGAYACPTCGGRGGCDPLRWRGGQGLRRVHPEQWAEVGT